jgi:hypothetical protein
MLATTSMDMKELPMTSYRSTSAGERMWSMNSSTESEIRDFDVSIVLG